MATIRKIDSRAISTNETGFGTNSEYSGGRFYNKDGTPNVEVDGVGFLKKISLYNTLLKMSGIKLFAVILIFYFVINLTFSGIYLALGPGNLGGADNDSTLNNFWEAFFFSAQTVSTVGYGHIYPKGLPTNIFAGMESLLGLLAFAFATAIIYGKFTQPRAYINFSHNALIAPYNNGRAVMFRMAPYKHNHLTDAEVKVTLAMKLQEDGIVSNKFYSLPLQISKVNALTISWTLVHPINEQSPFYNLTNDDLRMGSAELLIFFRAFDESFSNFVIARSSYIASDFVEGAKFRLMYHPSEDKQTTILDMAKLSEFDKVDIPILNEIKN
jgi:inward rectifier potassium channel